MRDNKWEIILFHVTEDICFELNSIHLVLFNLYFKIHSQKWIDKFNRGYGHWPRCKRIFTNEFSFLWMYARGSVYVCGMCLLLDFVCFFTFSLFSTHPLINSHGVNVMSGMKNGEKWNFIAWTAWKAIGINMVLSVFM